MNPGGLYGQARPENFPHVNDYRNSVVAVMMKALDYVNMFNHGISEVQELLQANENPEAEFNVSYLTAFSVKVKDPGEVSLSQACFELASNLSPYAKSLIISLKEKKMTASELQLVPELASGLSPKSKLSFKKRFIKPNLEIGLIERTHPDNPRHPQQKYFLTELGLAVLKILLNE